MSLLLPLRSPFRFKCHTSPLPPPLNEDNTTQNGLTSNPLSRPSLPLWFQVFANRVPSQREARNGHYHVTVDPVQRYAMDRACALSHALFHSVLAETISWPFYFVILRLDRLRANFRSNCEPPSRVFQTGVQSQRLLYGTR